MPSLEPCLISCIDVDGLGRRIEAAFSCIAAAHSLKPQGVRYVHIRLFELQHGNAGEIVEEWFGLSRVFPAISVQRSTQRSKSGTLRIGNVLHNLGEAAIGSHHRLVLRNAVEGEHLITSHTGRTLCSGMQQGPATSKFPASPALLANRSWLHGVETGLTRCARDHRTVHTHADCTFFFWCTVATARAGADWYAVLPYDEVPVCMHVLTTAPSPLSHRYAVLPLLQRAYAEAGAHSALRRTAEASSTPWSVEAAASRMRPIRVKLHIRTVKRRMSACFSGDAYLAILGAVRKRHQVYLAMLDEQHGLLSNSTRPRERSSTAAQQLDSHVSRRRLEFELHCDGHDHGSFINKEPICPSSTCNIQRALRAMQNMSDVRVVWQEGGSRSNRKRNVSDTSALVAVHQLLQADLLVISESSFSIVPSMLGNMTTLAPKCMSRALPHWHRLPCGHSRSVGGGLKATEVALLQRDIEKVVGSLAWPPHRPL